MLTNCRLRRKCTSVRTPGRPSPACWPTPWSWSDACSPSGSRVRSPLSTARRPSPSPTERWTNHNYTHWRLLHQSNDPRLFPPTSRSQLLHLAFLSRSLFPALDSSLYLFTRLLEHHVFFSILHLSSSCSFISFIDRFLEHELLARLLIEEATQCDSI